MARQIPQALLPDQATEKLSSWSQTIEDELYGRLKCGDC
jgi:hypothetical protein